MENKELATYIDQRKAAGATSDDIRHELVSAGWSDPDVAAAIGELMPAEGVRTELSQKMYAEAPAEIPVEPEAPKIFEPMVLSDTPEAMEPKAAAQPTEAVLPIEPEAPKLTREVAPPIGSEKSQPHTAELATSAVAMPVQSEAALAVAPELAESSLHQSVRVGLVLAIAAGVVILAGAGSAAAYYTGLLGTPSPTVLAAEAIASLQTASSYMLAATSTVEVIATSSPARAYGTVTESGTIDQQSSPHSPAYDLTLGLSLSSSDATSTGSGALSLHMIRQGTMAYFNLIHFDAQYQSKDPSEQTVGGMVTALTGMVTPYENQWMSVPVASSAVATTSTALAQDLADLATYFAGGSYIAGVQNDGVEATASGVPVYHLTVTLRLEQQLVDLLKKVTIQAYSDAATQTTMGEVALPPTNLSAVSATSTTARIEKLIGKTETVDLWVGKSDHRLYRIALAPITASTNANWTISTEAVLSNYNATAPVTAPTNAKPLQDILQSVFGPLLQQSQMRGVDAVIESDLSTLQTQAEIYYATNGNSYGRDNYCTTGMFTDETIHSVIGAMQQMGDHVTSGSLVCSANGSSYAVEASLPTSAVLMANAPPGLDTYYCVDSTGVAKETTKKIIAGHTFSCP